MYSRADFYVYNRYSSREEKEEKNMENRKTLAFQVSEDLFLRIKEYLQRNNMTQKEFVIHLIERELDRDQAIRMKKPSLNIPTIKISELCHNNVANPLITYLQA